MSAKHCSDVGMDIDKKVTFFLMSRYWVHMDEQGDAEGNYTLLSIDPSRPPGLYPLAVLHKSAPVMTLYVYITNHNTHYKLNPKVHAEFLSISL